MKRIALTFLIISLAMPLMAIFNSESYSLEADISGVSTGVKGFGWELFPLGTKFGFEKDFEMLKGEHEAEFKIEFEFTFNNRELSEDYDYLTGRPRWALRPGETGNFFGPDEWMNDTDWNDKDGERSLAYFNPRASINLYLEQGFWENPLDEGGTLFDIKLGLNSRFAMSLEEVSYSLRGHGGLDSPVFVNADGDRRKPFDSELPAYPWLNGSRNVLTNYIYLDLSLNMDRDTPTDAEAEEGLGVDFLFEAGPHWLLNNMTPEGIQSDYYRMELYAEQKMELFAVYQDNGWNWLNMYIGHSNTLRYTFGSVVPENKLPTDRLRGVFQDRIWIHFNGPQFMAGDCFTFIELNLYNTLLFGSVVNEGSGRTNAVELQSSFSTKFQLRLFGFIRLEYQLGYDFIRGIWPDKPEWWQNAALSFYVSL